jgi:RNA-directed DNA polymerase
MPGKPTNTPPLRLPSKREIRHAWEFAKKSGKKFSSSGVDGKSGIDFSSNLDVNVSRIASEIRTGIYQFNDLRCKWIEKNNSARKFRLICIPTVEDRLVQRSIAYKIESNDRLRLSNPISFGFMRGLGVASAIRRALELRNGDHRWAVKTDIISFFDEIDRQALVHSLGKEVPKSFLPFLEQVVRCEVRLKTHEDKTNFKESGVQRGKGLRQGMPLSPMLSNFVMRKFDEQVVKQKLNLVRYADDLIAFCDSEREAFSVLKQIEQWLSDLGHAIPSIGVSDKTKIVAPNLAVEFLGLELRKRRAVWVQ